LKNLVSFNKFNKTVLSKPQETETKILVFFLKFFSR